jgi:hypothetical protein
MYLLTTGQTFILYCEGYGYGYGYPCAMWIWQLSRLEQRNMQ